MTTDSNPEKPTTEPQLMDLKTRNLEAGVKVIQDVLKTLSHKPGVYRMLNHRDEALYVGKAKSLKNRVASYTRVNGLNTRIQRMVGQTAKMEIVVTRSEVEALLLEANLIKKLKPRFNVLLRDDKSFPYILITGDHDFALMTKHRGARKIQGDYFGPFTAGRFVNQTLTALQKAFMLRNCTDAMFASRRRPCLQYQIKRCTAPCVGKVSREDYQSQVDDAKAFLRARSQDVQKKLATQMQEASDALEFEEAGRLRDRIQALTAIQTKQDINFEGEIENADIFAAVIESGVMAVQVFFIRAGRNYGTKAYFPRANLDGDETIADALGALIAQFYANKPAPPAVYLSHEITNQALLAEACSQTSGYKVSIHIPQRGAKARAVDYARDNAREALARRLAEAAHHRKHLQDIQELFDLERMPQRIEIYDNSHTQGQYLIGAMVVAGPDGFDKSQYRMFKIRTAMGKGDDYAAMREVMQRRFKDAGPDSENWPDLVMLDGGKGQLSVAMEALAELGLYDKMNVVAISKGEDRNAGREQFWLPNQQPFQLPEKDRRLYYLQILRDEAHRFAITRHRAGRAKKQLKNPLDEVPGIGAVRKKALLQHFGSGKAVRDATVQDLQRVDGISASVAQKIHDYFHET